MKRKRECHILLLFIQLTLFCNAQPVHFTDRQRNQQREFIRKDTLPVQVNALPAIINSPFSEYNGRLLPDSSFYFTSMRSDVEADYDHYFESSWYCKIYESKWLSDGTFSTPEALPAIINNSHTFNSNFCFNQAHTLLIYSRCTRTGTGELSCQLWQSERKGRNWGKPVKLPPFINLEGCSTMQPYLASYYDHDILYFVSDRPEGNGGNDIWFSILKDKRYSNPINAGSIINTEGNEVTPFYDTNSNTLYFSSDEHLGIGDYDIFYSQGALSQWGEVSNMGIPFNSEYNDYYFTLGNDDRSGFFSSNRPHNGASTDTCCNDLFHFQWLLEKDNRTDSMSNNLDKTADTLPSLIPVTLYFENDQPNPRSISDTTIYDYPTLYHHYQSIFNHAPTSEEITFFSDSVAFGFDQLSFFTKNLRSLLEKGFDIEIAIYGYASPLHHSDYNVHLSARRIVSFLNFLRKTEDGFFIPYLQENKTGLTISTFPEGAVNHQFTSNDERETVYSIQAMKDRKILIVPKVNTISTRTNLGKP